MNVALTPGQLKTLQSKHAVSCGTTITLTHVQRSGGPNKISQQKNRIRIDFSVAAIKDMTKTGGIFPLLAEIPTLIAAAAPAVAKSAALGAVGTAAEMALKKVNGNVIVHKEGQKTDKHERKYQQDVQQK